MNPKLQKSFKAGGTGNAVFNSVEAFADHQDFARREHAAILAFRADLASGMPLADAEAFLREDLKVIGEENEDWIQGILQNPDRDPESFFSSGGDMVEA